MLYNSRRTNTKGKLIPHMQLLIDNIDLKLLREQRNDLLDVLEQNDIDTVADLRLSGLVDLLDHMIDIAETQDGRLVWRRQESQELNRGSGDVDPFENVGLNEQ